MLLFQAVRGFSLWFGVQPGGDRRNCAHWSKPTSPSRDFPSRGVSRRLRAAAGAGAATMANSGSGIRNNRASIGVVLVDVSGQPDNNGRNS